MKAGADVNYKNAVGLFPLAVAAAIGNHSTLRVLVKSKGVNLNEKVDGITVRFMQMCHVVYM